MTKIIEGNEAIEFAHHLASRLPNTFHDIRLIHIDKVTLVNPVFKAKQTMKDLFFFCKDTSERPLFITEIRDETNRDDIIIYSLHHDYNHTNMSGSDSSYSCIKIDDKLYSFKGKSFCNPINQSNLFREPNKFSKLLKGQLLENNFNDRWRTISAIDIEGYEQPLRCAKCGALIPTNSVNPLVATTQLCSACLTSSELIEGGYIDKLKNFKHLLEVNKNNRLIYHYNGYRWGYGIVDVKNFKQDFYNGKVFSSYYKSFKDGDITDADCAIPTIEKQALFAGLGSANSAIIDLTSRGDIINDYTLVDFDTVEYKNLRNQIYQQRNVTDTKTNATKQIINQNYSGEPVTPPTVKTFSNRIESVSMPYVKFKYLFSGFDSFEVRKKFLSLIKEGEFKGKYLIDTRYEGQNCSVFFIDLEKEEELKYYETLLEEDEKIFNANIKIRPLNEREIANYSSTMIAGACSATWARLKGNLEDKDFVPYVTSFPCGNNPIGCGDPECLKCQREALTRVRIKETPENTCVAVNQIAIYKFVGTYIYLALKQIEQGKEKPFTYIELSTEEMPQVMIMRK